MYLEDTLLVYVRYLCSFHISIQRTGREDSSNKQKELRNCSCADFIRTPEDCSIDKSWQSVAMTFSSCACTHASRHPQPPGDSCLRVPPFLQLPTPCQVPLSQLLVLPRLLPLTPVHELSSWLPVIGFYSKKQTRNLRASYHIHSLWLPNGSREIQLAQPASL